MTEVRQVLTGLSERGVRFGLGLIHDWTDPFGRLFLQTLAMIAEFEANLIRLRTREGMAVAKRKGELRGKQPKLPESAQRSIRSRYAEGGLFGRPRRGYRGRPPRQRDDRLR